MALKAQLVPYAMLKVGFFNITTSYEGWNVNIWPPEQVSSLTAQKTEGASYYISDRNYLTETRQRRVPFADSGTETDVLKSLDIDNVYPEGDPQICSTTEGTRVAVWIADDGSKASADRTTLYYAVIKDGVITCSGAVCETGRGDYSPTLLAKGNSSQRFAERLHSVVDIAPEVFQDYADELMRRTGRVTAVLDIDLDRGEFSTLDALNGWETYTIRDVSTAAWHANRKDHLAWERRLDIFAGHLETRMLRCDAPEAEPTNGPVM